MALSESSRRERFLVFLLLIGVAFAAVVGTGLSIYFWNRTFNEQGSLPLTNECSSQVEEETETAKPRFDVSCPNNATVICIDKTCDSFEKQSCVIHSPNDYLDNSSVTTDDIIKAWLEEIAGVKTLRTPRCLGVEPCVKRLISNASRSGCGAVDYMRLEYHASTTTCSILSKSGTTPTNLVRVLHLELQASALLYVNKDNNADKLRWHRTGQSVVLHEAKKFKQPEIPQWLIVRLLDMSKGQHTGCDIFVLNCHVDGALAVIFTSSCRLTYPFSFSFIQLAICIEFISSNLWKQ
ncbi:hypothetical protein Smp_147340 [Schistosoma mansoni]|uniref:Ig-like domain-containing protein n=1 Tax=Schistosoma mansoni TaxID=6183 RepID=G4VCM4_SCHMA|nr:hypothetical protein Smp_147340 [Schistosoma mansoni]|eukprot:XP_018650271.1 hypothetical protein Smp_147340 [Schistosoma mansoni]